MSLRVHIDSNGLPITEFPKLRDQLIAAHRTFTPAKLCNVPYSQLALCATAEAGSAACPVGDVVAEKRARRQRFVTMTDEQRAACERYLHVHDMMEDIKWDLTMMAAPPFDAMTELQKAWVVLNCLHNHIDNPEERLERAILHIRRGESRDQLTPREADVFIKGLWAIINALPITTDSKLWQIVNSAAAVLLERMTEDEKAALLGEVIHGYHCTSDCYQYRTGIVHV